VAESAYRKVQMGKESALGTEVDATFIFPVDPGSTEFTLNRATQVPNEDYGRSIRNQTGRGSHGVKNATATLSAPARFEDVGRILSIALGSAVATGSGTVTNVWDRDTTSATHNSYTVESDDGVQPFVATGVVCTGFELGFDALGPGENSMWQVSADLQAANVAQGTATAGLSDPSTLETMEGHLSILRLGTTATAFGSLSELSASLVSYRYRDTFAKPGRPYGGSETYSSVGASKDALGEVTILLKVSSDTIDASWDIFAVAGSVPTERRARVTVDGSGDNVFHVDHRLLFTDVHIEPDGRDGERLVSITAETMYDSTLGSDTEFTLVSSTGTSF
jgi:hypothetical protein